MKAEPRIADGALTDFTQPLRRFIRRRVSDPHAADDIAQDVFLKLQANLDAVPTDHRRLAAWIFRTARNAIVDHYRAAAVRGHDRLDADASRVPIDADEPRVTAEVVACLRCMIERLDEPYRAALKLADLEGLGQQEIASRTGVSLSGAKSRVQRARQQLRTMLVACCHFDRDARGNVIGYEPSERAAARNDGDDPACDAPPCDCC